jgi:DUF4097 and DUF4098 domain-containing protein YvlB
MRRAVLLLLVTFAAAVASASTLTETVDRTFDARPGAVVSVDNTNGAITITSWDQPRIRVHAEKVVERADAAEAKDMMRQLRVEMQPRDGGVVIRTDNPRSNGAGFWDLVFGHWVDAKVTYEITVPRSMSLAISDTNGAVHVDGVTGMLKVETTNGRIEMQRCGGSIDATSTNGRVNAELLTVDASRMSRFETTNGAVSVTVPPALRADVDASTTNGHIDTDLPVLAHWNGRNAMRGTINGGGAKLRIRTTNGSIAIRTTHA